ncbi:hypothetical protein [Streptomyces pseudogriseolus]|uniref:hypothetical protein n=1 Tax=Streptomyces pseudogriseolus TaxID=36817 RepID=UPI003FA33238
MSAAVVRRPPPTTIEETTVKAYPEPVVTPAEIHVSLLPPDHCDYHLRTVRVGRAGRP